MDRNIVYLICKHLDKVDIDNLSLCCAQLYDYTLLYKLHHYVLTINGDNLLHYQRFI